jgi:hypothetical protein
LLQVVDLCEVDFTGLGQQVLLFIRRELIKKGKDLFLSRLAERFDKW